MIVVLFVWASRWMSGSRNRQTLFGHRLILLPIFIPIMAMSHLPMIPCVIFCGAFLKVPCVMTESLHHGRMEKPTGWPVCFRLERAFRHFFHVWFRQASYSSFIRLPDGCACDSQAASDLSMGVSELCVLPMDSFSFWSVRCMCPSPR